MVQFVSMGLMCPIPETNIQKKVKGKEVASLHFNEVLPVWENWF